MESVERSLVIHSRHYLRVLHLVEVSGIANEDGKERFCCMICHTDPEHDGGEKNWRLVGGTTSNVLKHFRQSHPEVKEYLDVLSSYYAANVKQRGSKKRARADSGQSTLDSFAHLGDHGVVEERSSLSSTKRSKFDGLVALFVSQPDRPKRIVEDKLFRRIITSAAQRPIPPSVPQRDKVERILNEMFAEARHELWTRIAEATFVVAIFDGWSMPHARGSLVSVSLVLTRSFRSQCLFLSEMPLERHTAMAMANYFHGLNVDGEAMGARRPPRLPGHRREEADRPPIDFFVSDSAPANPAAVARFYNKPQGWKQRFHPCWSHKVQLVCKHAASLFIDNEAAENEERTAEHSGDGEQEGEEEAIEEEEEEPQNPSEMVALCESAVVTADTELAKLRARCRGIVRLCNTSHVQMASLQRLRRHLNMKQRKLVSDSKTRFDSTMAMFKSIVAAKEALQILQQKEDWPAMLALSPDDFNTARVIVKVLEPMAKMSALLGSDDATIADILPRVVIRQDLLCAKRDNAPSGSLERSLTDIVIKRIEEELLVPLLGSGTVFPSLTSPTIYELATALDPRWLGFARQRNWSTPDHMKTALQLVERELLHVRHSGRQEDEEDTTDGEQMDPVVDEDDGALDDEVIAAFGLPVDGDRIRTRSYARAPSIDRHGAIGSEFDVYVEVVKKTSLALKDGLQVDVARSWWREHRVDLPRLACVAELLFGIPASSLWQERHFSRNARRVKGLANRTQAATMERDGFVLENYELLCGLL